MSKITLALALLALTSLLAMPALAETVPDLPAPDSNEEATVPTTLETTTCQASSSSLEATSRTVFAAQDICVVRACTNNGDCLSICQDLGGSYGFCIDNTICPNKICLCAQ